MIIAVAHSKGGVGKSTIAFNLALSLVKHTARVELVDLDLQRTITHANTFRSKYNLKPLPILSFEDLKSYKEYVMRDDDTKISIVDVGGFDSDLNRFVIVTADIVITPVSASGRELLGLKRFREILEKMSAKTKTTIKAHVLLNNINPQKSKLEDLKEYLSSSSSFTLLNTVLRRRVDYDYSMDEGKSVIEYSKRSKASREIKSLTKEIQSIIKENDNG